MQKIVTGEFEGETLSLTVQATRLDAATAGEFKKECQGLWQGPVKRLVVDLNAVEFIDSSGIGALLSIYKRLPPDNPSVKLLNAKPAVQSVIELLRLNRVFEIKS